MKNKKVITKAYVTHFDEAIFTQTLVSGRTVKATYYRNDNMWTPIYETDSVYSICPITGEFKNCFDCDFFEDNYNHYLEDSAVCMRQSERISHKELAARATDCLNADGCTVSFRSAHGEL